MSQTKIPTWSALKADSQKDRTYNNLSIELVTIWMFPASSLKQRGSQPGQGSQAQSSSPPMERSQRIIISLLSSNRSNPVKVWMILLENHFQIKELLILLSSDTLNCLYLPLPGNTDVLPVTLRESGCFPSHPVCSHLSCLPLISFHLPPVMFSICPCLTAACFPLGQVFFDAWPQHQASPQIQLELGCRFQIKFLGSVILHEVWRA